jgi:lysozyme family protein
MRGDLEASMKIIFGEEGGYVNNPRDPGGATKFGITAATLGAWRKAGSPATPTEVRNLELPEARDIIDNQFARHIAFDRLPPGLDLAVLDYAVNSGPAQAAKSLQRLLDVDRDGIIGSKTLAAIPLTVPTLIDRYMDERMRFLKALRTWGTFGKGWTRRVERIRALAKKMAAEEAAPASKATGSMVKDSPAPAPQVEVHKAPPSQTTVASTTRGRAAIGTVIFAGATAVVPWAQHTIEALQPYQSLKYVPVATMGLTVLGGLASLVLETKHIADGAPQ